VGAIDHHPAVRPNHPVLPVDEPNESARALESFGSSPVLGVGPPVAVEQVDDSIATVLPVGTE
jgi:hypothetical protein